MIQSRGEKIFGVVNIIFLTLLSVATLFPVMYIVSVSLTPLEALARHGGFRIIPAEVTLDAYRFLLNTPLIPRAFLNSVIITVLGTTANLLLTTLLAYPLSKKLLPGRTPVLGAVLFTMLFGGGLVPTYILIKNLGLIDSYWSAILPGAISTYNLLVMKSFFENMPEDIMEAARIDGAGEMRILWQIVLPLSKPVIATLGLFYAVAHWNGFFDAMMFINDVKLQPLQVVLRNVLMDAMRAEDFVTDQVVLLPGETIKMAAIVVAMAPMLAVYPWIQKHFTKGVLLGSIKG